jgi:site-specific DNA recombinase
VRLKGISFGANVLEWVTTTLKESHRDQRQFHEEAVAKLQLEHRRIQARIDAMYMDKLDGRIDNEFFDRKAVEFRSEQGRLMREIDAHQSANEIYTEQGVRILELAQKAPQLFESQPPIEKRKLLDFVVSNGCSPLSD